MCIVWLGGEGGVGDGDGGKCYYMVFGYSLIEM